MCTFQSVVLHSIIQIDRCTGHYSRLRLSYTHMYVHRYVVVVLPMPFFPFASSKCFCYFCTVCIFFLLSVRVCCCYCCTSFIPSSEILICLFASYIFSSFLRLCAFFLFSLFLSVLNRNCTNSPNTRNSLSFITFIQYDWPRCVYLCKFEWVCNVHKCAVAMVKESLVADWLMISTLEKISKPLNASCCIM